MTEAELALKFDQPQLWTPKEQMIVKNSALIFGTMLTWHTDMTPIAAFNSIIGLTYVRYTKTLVTGASSFNNVLRFRHPSFVRLALIVHEWAHAFDRAAGLLPQRELWLAKLDLKNGTVWGGMHPPSKAGYGRNETWANIMADYTLQMLAMNEAGAKIVEFMNTNMPVLILKAQEKTKWVS